MNPSSDTIITLRAGELVLDLAPRCGGIIAGFRRGRDLIMRAPDLALIESGNPRGSASWPLVPYSNRIRNGLFTWRGKPIRLESDEIGGKHAIHGNGWRRPWAIDDLSESATVWIHAHRADGFWPFDYEARQAYALTEDELALWMSVTNTGTEPMPAGLGHHPYFHRTSDATLRFVADEMWENDADVLPLRRVKLPPSADFSTAKLVNNARLDAVFVGWRRPVEVVWPSAKLRMSVDADAIFGRIVVFVPPGQNYFAIEPVTHDTDAVNRPEQSGLVTLAPGESLAGTMRFRIESL
jgi:aldose 1-epimerase